MRKTVFFSLVLTILLSGSSGEAYNVADEKTYCSIAEMAEMVAKAKDIRVLYDIQDTEANGFLNTLYMNLDVSKLKKLGWSPVNGGKTIVEMFDTMMVQD